MNYFEIILSLIVKSNNFHLQISSPFFVSDHSCHQESLLIKGPQSAHIKHLIAPPPPSYVSLLLSRGLRATSLESGRLAWARRQIDIRRIDISCSGPRNHFHFTLCCTGKIRHLRYPANQMSFNRTLSLTFTTVYPTNFS